MDEKNHPGSEYYRTLRRKMALLVIAVSLTPLILISSIILYQFHVSYHEKVLAHLEEVVLKHRQSIDSFLNEKLADIRVMAKTFTLEQLRDQTFLQGKLATLQGEYGGVFVDLGLVNEDGLQVAYAGGFKLGRVRYTDADWYKKAMNSQHFISNVFLGIRGLPHFIVAVKKESHGSTWILPRMAELVVRRYVDLLKHENGPITAEDENHSETTDLLWKKTNGQSRVTVTEEDSSIGGKYISVSTPLKNGEWLLVYRQDAGDAFADLYQARRVALIILLLGGVGIVSMAFILSKSMISHIALADREKDLMNQQVIEAGKLASVGELAAGIAHEINNPVAIMVEEAGWIGDLLDEEQTQEALDAEEMRRALTQIRSQGLRCKEITHKLLSFARKTDPKFQEVQINNLIEEVVSLSEQRAKYDNVKIELHLAPGLPNIKVSPSEFQQVVLNLINNAFDTMASGGGTLRLTSTLEGEHAVIEVADTGQGIPEANLSRIFDPFFTTKPVGQGTGLGLSICYGIIKKLGGELSVDSIVGMGTVFRMRLPVKGYKDNQAGTLGKNQPSEHPKALS
jgi:two-component system NtrC family sensor kinase